jgi:ADP-heptose:LPS heptosyltransferase
LIGASRIVGTEGINKGIDFVLTEKLENKPVHEIQRRIEIVGGKSGDFSMELSVSKEDCALADLFLRGVPPYIPLVGLHPGSKDAFKQSPPGYFIEVGNRLKHHLGCQIIVTGNRDEKELVSKVAKGIEGAIPIAGQLSIHALGALIQKMSLMISNDTGPMHIGFSMKTPVLGLFGPTDHRLCGPYFVPRAVVIQKEKTCTPCLKKKCHEPFCLLQISKEEVFQAAQRAFYEI